MIAQGRQFSLNTASACYTAKRSRERTHNCVDADALDYASQQHNATASGRFFSSCVFRSSVTGRYASASNPSFERTRAIQRGHVRSSQRVPLNSISLDLYMPSTDYVRTDTAEDAVSSLELAADFLERAVADDRYWKWFVVALHSGVQSMFALTLEAGNGFLVQKPGVMIAMLAAHESGKEVPQPHTDNFLNLYKKVQRVRTCEVPTVHRLNHRQRLTTPTSHLTIFETTFSTSIRSRGALSESSSSKALEAAQKLQNSFLARAARSFWHEEAHQQRAVIALQQLPTLLHEQI